MTEQKIKRIYAVCGWILSALILVTGICFAVSCVSIYRSGDKPFSRESVALAFEKIAIPVYLCIAGVIGCGVLSLVLPLPTSKVKAITERKITLERVLSGVSEEDLENSLKEKLSKERRMRQILRVVCVAICLVAAVISAVYACNPSHYTLENLNGDILSAVLVVLSCAVLSLAACYVLGVLLCDASMKREMEVLSAVPKTRGVKKEQKISRPQPWRPWVIRGVILLVGIFFVLMGIFNGGAEDVLGKAIRICTECIGLG